MENYGNQPSLVPPTLYRRLPRTVRRPVGNPSTRRGRCRDTGAAPRFGSPRVTGVTPGKGVGSLKSPGPVKTSRFAVEGSGPDRGTSCQRYSE